MKKIAFLASCALAAGISTSASAVTFTSVPYAFDDVVPGSTVINFDDPLPAGFSISGGTIQSGTSAAHAAPGVLPGVYETTKYLSGNPNDSATITSTTGYRNVSIYWGSIDDYNTITFLDKLGNTIDSFTGSDITDQIPATANGNQLAAETNRRVYFLAEATDPAIYGVRFESRSPAFETDNVSFSGAVPEPSTWAMMILGFGVAGVQLRNRRSARRLVAA